jgi:2'-5' RNA ligase
MSRRATARLFVAVDPPAAVCEELAVWARQAAAGLDVRARDRAGPALRLLDPDSMHLTLCFLGSRPVEQIERIGSALQRCVEPASELHIGAPLWLPPRRPRALAVAVHDPGGGLARLHNALVGALGEAIGWQPERRRFRAHLTIARIGRGASLRHSERGEWLLPATPALSFTPEEVVLYRSWLRPEGASYEALASSGLVPSESNSSPAGEDGPVAGGAGQRSPEAAAVGEDPSAQAGSEPSAQE